MIQVFVIVFVFSYQLQAQVFAPHAFWNCKTGSFTQTDDTAAEFNAGTFSNTTVSGNTVVLSAGQTSGTYTSKIHDLFYGCRTDLRTWLSHSWKTTLPTYKEITSTSELATDYSAISANLMTSLVGYWKHNGTVGGIANGATITATVGSNGTVTGGAGLAYTNSGKLLQGIQFNNAHYVSVPHYANIMPTTNLTVSVWAYATSLAGGSGYPSILGKVSSTAWTDGYGMYYLAGTGLCFFVRTWNTRRACQGTTTSLTTGMTHIVGTYDGSNIRLYWNGALVTTTAYAGTINANASALFVGNMNNVYYWNGIIDDVAIWNRTLSDAEVLLIYRRAANRLRFQVRSCTMSDCSDAATWKGPDGTNATYFTELNNNSVQETSTGNVLTASPAMTYTNFLSLLLPTNRFFQYRVYFDTDNSTYSPTLESVNFQR